MLTNVKTASEIKPGYFDNDESDKKSVESEEDVSGNKVLNFFGSYISLSKTDRIKASENEINLDL